MFQDCGRKRKARLLVGLLFCLALSPVAGCLSSARGADTGEAIADQDDWQRFLSGSSGSSARHRSVQVKPGTPAALPQSRHATSYDIASPGMMPEPSRQVGNFSAPVWVINTAAGTANQERPPEIRVETGWQPFDDTSSAGLAAKTFMLGAMTGGLPYFPGFGFGGPGIGRLGFGGYSGNAFYGYGRNRSFVNSMLPAYGLRRPYNNMMGLNGLMGMSFRGGFMPPFSMPLSMPFLRPSLLPLGFYGGAAAFPLYSLPLQQPLSQWGWNSNTRVLQTGPSPSSGNYYNPSSGNPSSSGGYYSSPSTPVVIPSSADNPADYWGPQGNPFAEQLNK